MQTPPQLDVARHALFIDFDGTLVGFEDDPAAVAIVPEALKSITHLQEAMDGALAIVSGRRIRDLDGFLAPLTFAAAGVHGLETRGAPGAPVKLLADHDALEMVREALQGAVEAEPRMKLEDKGTALVLHYRGHPELEGEARRLMRAAAIGRSDLTIMEGNHIVEVHPAGMDKGLAVRALMRSAPFAGRVPVYVGDDTTDEFALKVVAELGGVGVKVGEGETAATTRLPNVPAVHAWLLDACRLAGR